MNDTYTQCMLQQGDSIQIAWIPSVFAVQGKNLLIDGEGEWRVETTYPNVKIEADLVDVNRKAMEHMKVVARL
jgi:hypothetical protein